MSKIKVDTIQSTQHATSTIALTSTGATVNGDCNATTFTGSGANLTSLPSANLTGALPAIDGSALTGISSGVTVQEEGSSLSTAGTTLNFVGAGVTASGTGASKTITVPGGGGGMEFVSKTTVSSLTGILDFTLDADSVYRFVCRRFQHSSNSNVLMKLMTNGSSSLYSGGDIRVYFNNDAAYGTERSASDVEFDPGSNYGQNDFFIMDVSTYLYGWFLVDGGLLSSSSNTPSGHHSMRYRIYGQIDTYSSNYISTVRLTSRFASIDTGTEVLLYKYKQS